MTIYRTHKGKRTNITKQIASISWGDSTDSIGGTFNIELPYSYWDDNFDTQMGVGDIITVYDNYNEVFRGIIVEAPINGSSYSGYDYGWYLNKTEVIIQFNGIGASKAINQLLARCDTPIGTIAAMTTSIKKLYKDECVADIINDILDKVKSETGKTYRVEMNEGKLDITQAKTTKLTPTYKDEYGNTISCSKTAEISGTRSIENMKNKVIVAGTSTEKKEIKATSKSDTSIEKYGLLSMVETEDNLTEAKARNKAKNLLKEYNKVTKSFNATMRGDMSVRSGRKMYFERPEVGIEGWFDIKSCTHEYRNGIHTMNLTLEN